MVGFLGGIGLWITLGVIVGLIVLVVMYIWSTYNGLIKKRNDTDEAFSTMDVYMKKRYDLIPNLVETVKGYAKHEKEALTNIIQARNACISAHGTTEKAQAETQLTQSLKSIFALSEAYPDLKANTNFLDLQGQLKSLEVDIANARKYYNAVVKTFNNAIDMFPSNIIARWFHFERKEMFVIDENERKNVKVEF